MSLLLRFLNGLLFVLPAYIANSSPTVLGGGSTIDGGKTAPDGRPILGAHKTWQGLGGGILLGVSTGFLVFLIGNYGLKSVFHLSNSLIDCLLRAFLLSLGTHIGDLTCSFVKRRLRIRSGEPFLVVDQLGFFLFAVLFAAPLYWQELGWLNFAIWTGLTLGVHPLFNLIAWAAGLQEEIL